MPCLCEFNGIRLQVQYDLHNSLSIVINYWTFKTSQTVFRLRNSFISGKEFDSFALRLLNLNLNYFVNRILQIEIPEIPSELASFDLSVVQEVLYEMLH
jgi:hypothetical protein